MLVSIHSICLMLKTGAKCASIYTCLFNYLIARFTTRHANHYMPTTNFREIIPKCKRVQCVRDATLISTSNWHWQPSKLWEIIKCHNLPLSTEYQYLFIDVASWLWTSFRFWFFHETCTDDMCIGSTFLLSNAVNMQPSFLKSCGSRNFHISMRRIERKQRQNTPNNGHKTTIPVRNSVIFVLPFFFSSLILISNGNKLSH